VPKYRDSTDAFKNGSPSGKITIEPIFGDPIFAAYGPKVEFKAFIKTLRDEHKTHWDMSELFTGTGKGITHRHGRQNRILTLSFDVPAHSKSEARDNLRNLTTLVQMMYPTRSGTGANDKNAKSGMIHWKITFANLIRGAVCIVESFAVVPDFTVGVFTSRKGRDILPKLYTVDISAEYNPGNPNLFNGLKGDKITFFQGSKPDAGYPYGQKSWMLGAKPDPTKQPIPQTEPPNKGETTPGNDGDEVDKDLGDDSSNDSPTGAGTKVPSSILRPNGLPMGPGGIVGPWQP